jgi:hypothetical protein
MHASFFHLGRSNDQACVRKNGTSASSSSVITQQQSTVPAPSIDIYRCRFHFRPQLCTFELLFLHRSLSPSGHSLLSKEWHPTTTTESESWRRRLRPRWREKGYDSPTMMVAMMNPLTHDMKIRRRRRRCRRRSPQRNHRWTKLTPLGISWWPRTTAGSSSMATVTPPHRRRSHAPPKCHLATCAQTPMAATMMTSGCK